MRTLAALGLCGLALAGCRADIDGRWDGTIGAQKAELSIEQDGALIRGEACVRGRCSTIDHGHLEDDQLTFEFRCDGCNPALFQMDLSAVGDELEGTAHTEPCTCEDGACGCARAAHFTATY